MQEITLIEYQTQSFPQEQIPFEIGKIIHQKYSTYLAIKEPSQLKNTPWQITPKGYIGILPVTRDFTLRILPKTAITYVWQMIDYVDQLDSLAILDQLTNCDRLEDICDRLAFRLAEKILKRTRQGLYRCYIPHQERRIAPRGKIQWPQTARQPWETRLPCRYAEHTGDIPENQILLWTLHQLRRSPYLFKPATQQKIRQAHRAIQGAISLIPATPQDCQNFTYHRLNQDYQGIHQLCRFFLEHLTASHHSGEGQSLPFVVNTAALYEKFVFAWLKKNLPESYEIKAQETHHFTEKIQYRIDLVIRDRRSQEAIAVLDTKYKTPHKPSQNDINQIAHYALLKQSRRGVLVYPEPLPHGIDRISENIHIQTLTFALDGAIGDNGNHLLGQLFPPR